MLINAIRDAMDRVMIESGIRPTYVRVSPQTYSRIVDEGYRRASLLDVSRGFNQIMLNGVYVYSNVATPDTMAYIYTNQSINVYPLPYPITAGPILDSVSDYQFLGEMNKKTKKIKRNLPEWW